MGAWEQATTSEAGNDAKTTAIAVALSRKPAQYFRGWYAHLTSVPEYRRVESSQADGSLTFYAGYPWTTKVPTATVLDLYSHDPAVIDEAIREALNQCYPTFFNDVDDETLRGKMPYGTAPNQYNDRVYDLPSSFMEAPTSIWLLDSYFGTHDGAESTTVLEDSTQHMTEDELIGQTPRNSTDGSAAATVVTANTETTVTHGALAGGSLNKWSDGDKYIVTKRSAVPVPLSTSQYNIVNPTQKGAFRMTASIDERYVIRLVGKKRLTYFGVTEVSETELTETQARPVALLAAAIAFSNLAKRRPGDNGLMDQAMELRAEYYSLVGQGMPTVEKWTVDYAGYYRSLGPED